MSDAHRDEIAKLEALYREHPEGRVFTHLAEAYRKAGEPERARDVLTQGIERHPDYSSAHVVLGRVLLDLGQLEEARREFQRVLELDQHNLVALRSLGDIAHVEGRTDDALARYRELLELEPSDSDVLALVNEITVGPDLTTVGRDSGRESWAATSPETGAAAATDEDRAPAVEHADEGEPEEPVAAQRAEAGAEEELAEETEPTVETDEEEAEPVVAEAPEDRAGEVQEDEEAEVWTGEIEAAEEEAWTGEVEADEEETWTGEVEADEEEPWTGEVEADEEETWPTAAEGPEEWTGAEEDDEWGVAADTDEEAGATDEEGDWFTGMVEEPTEEDASEPAGADSADDLERELAGESEDGADVMTETIAQVYARQGLYDRAVEVYKGLLEKRPDDEGLKERLASVEAMAEEERAEAEQREPVEAAGTADTESAAEVDDSEVIAAGIEADPSFEDMEATEDSVVAGFEATGQAADEDVAPLEGLEAHETDPETGLVADTEAEEAAAEPVEAEPEEPVGEVEPASDEDVWEAPWDEPFEAEAEEAPEEPREPSPWVADDWSGAEAEAETPYAWADTEEAEDGSPPIGDYLAGILDWGARVTPPEPAPSDGEQDGGTVPARDEGTAPEGGDDDDDDLEMFRSWLESLKQ